MKLIKEQTKLADVLLIFPFLIPVINRFGIRLGVGDKTIEAICKEHHIHVELFVTIINTLAFDSYFPKVKLQTFSVLQTIEYLHRTHYDYLRVQLINIERHIFGLIKSSENSKLGLLHRFFNEYKQEISGLIRREEEEMFPHIVRVYELYFSPDYDLSYEGDLSLSVQQFGKEYETVNEKLYDLKNIILKYLQGEYDTNLCYAVVVALNNLETDMNSNLRMQERVLKPMVMEMESEIRRRGGLQ